MRLIRLLKTDLARESVEWVEDEIISESQAVKICQKYDIDYFQAQNHSFAYNVLISLAYLFIGLAVITLLGANWDDIPRAVRMGGLITLTMVTQYLAVRKYFLTESHGATGLFLLGNMFFGAAIILIAQIYHLGEHMPDGVFWWALGCLPIAVLTKSTWLTLQSLLLALLWFLIEVSMGFYPLFFPVFILAGVWILYHTKQSILLLLTVMVSFVLWLEFSLAEYWRDGRHFDFHVEHFVVSMALFVFVYVFSHWLNQKKSILAKDYGAVLAIWSLRFGLICLLVLSAKGPWKDLINANWQYQTSMLVMVGIILIGSLWLAYKSNKLSPIVYIIPFYLCLLIAVLLSGDTGQAIYFQIAINLVLVITGIWLIIRGIHSGISHYFFLGVASILMTAFLRYVDLIGDYIGGAVLFMVFAFILLSAAKYWKNYHAKQGLI